MKPQVAVERRQSQVMTAVVSKSGFLEVDRWGQLTKAIRVVAWLMRFIHNSRRTPRILTDLSLDEMRELEENTDVS